MAARVAVVGSLNMDLVARAPRMPKPGETILGSDFWSAPGGKGANQAVAAARLGAQVCMIGRVGQDTLGESLLKSLASDDVETGWVNEDPHAATGVALIVVDDVGENSIVVAAGANGCLSPADVEHASDAIANADILLLQLEIPLETVTRAAEIAHDLDVRVVLNPAPARPLPLPLLRLVDVIIPNESETALLTDQPIRSEGEMRAAAASLLLLGVDTVLVTCGVQGALLASTQGEMLVPAYQVTPVDTTAAGDAFVAGFAVALAEGKPMRRAVEWANAAGALATTKVGAQPSLPIRQAVRELLDAGVTRS